MAMRQVSQDDVFLVDRRHVHFVTGRSRHLPGDGTWGLLLFLVLFQAFGMFFVAWIGHESLIFARLRWDGQQALATVTDLHVHSDSDGETHQVGYLLKVQQPAGWLMVRGKDQIGEAAYDALQPQGPIPVVYSASDPTVLRAQAASWQKPLALFGFSVFLVLWYAIPLALTLWCVRDIWQRLVLVRQGQLLQGEVVQTKGERDSDGDYQLTVQYRLQAPDGRILTGSVSRIRNELAGEPPIVPGTPLAILYCPPSTVRVL
jgi:hypothetical protein